MAKVVITIEDIERDGDPSIRMSVDSDNKDSKEYTPAEAIAEQIYSSILSHANKVTTITTGKPDDTTLN